MNSEHKNKTKNIRTQCCINEKNPKPVFKNSWNPDTDDEFSDYEI